MLSEAKKVAFLTGHPLFGLLPGDMIRTLAAEATLRSLRPGEILCRQGESGVSLYLLLGGRLEVVREGVGEIASIGRRGEIIGEMALLTNLPRTATVRAELESSIVEIPAVHFTRLLERQPSVGILLARILSERLAETPSPTRLARRACYLGLVAGGPQRREIARLLAEDLATEAQRPILLCDVEPPPDASPPIESISDIPLAQQEDFVRAMAKPTRSGVRELACSFTKAQWNYFLGVFREVFDRVVFLLPPRLYRESHQIVTEACDLLIGVCGGEVVQAGRAAARAAIPALRRLLCMTKDKESPHSNSSPT